MGTKGTDFVPSWKKEVENVGDSEVEKQAQLMAYTQALIVLRRVQAKVEQEIQIVKTQIDKLEGRRVFLAPEKKEV